TGCVIGCKHAADRQYADQCSTKFGGKPMADSDSLYRELKGSLQAVAEPLFEHACQQVEKRGAFLPVGSKLSSNGEIGLVAAAPEEDVTSSDVVLPLLIAALRESAAAADAVALCEWVKIEAGGRKPSDAVKVHAQHRRGLSVAFYIPATKSLFRGWQFGEMMVMAADPFIASWPGTDAEPGAAADGGG
ncbi:MAG: hypothetical protein WD069_04250, partial [Planctomycetales bacterium]